MYISYMFQNAFKVDGNCIILSNSDLKVTKILFQTSPVKKKTVTHALF